MAQDARLDRFRLPKKANIKFLFDDLAGAADVLEPIVKAIVYRFNFDYDIIQEIYKVGTSLIQVDSELRTGGSYAEWRWGVMQWDLTTGKIDKFTITDKDGKQETVIMDGEA